MAAQHQIGGAGAHIHQQDIHRHAGLEIALLAQKYMLSPEGRRCTAVGTIALPENLTSIFSSRPPTGFPS